jgi:curved DNA-binding protein CbpA
MKNADHYELLQISPKADQDTIHRVYRFLAARYHPDNPRSGDAEVFSRLKEAYDVLSDPARRAEYDANYQPAESERMPLSASIDFMDNREGELNRRLALLAVLYHRRRTTPNKPEMSLAEVEKLMGFPRDFLDFTTWYLHRKGYISRADNSDFALTAEGVDFVETQHVNFPTLHKLLTSGTQSPAPEPTPQHVSSPQPPMIVLPDLTLRPDRRVNGGDRRVNTRDRRVNTMDRRQNGGDRRVNPADNCSDLTVNHGDH